MGFLNELGVDFATTSSSSSDTSEEQGRNSARAAGTVDCCYPVKCISGHYGELIFGQKQKINTSAQPHDLLPAVRSLYGHVGDTADLHRA